MSRALARARATFVEFLHGEMGGLARPASEIAAAGAGLLGTVGRRESAWRLRMKLYSRAYSPAVDRRVLAAVVKAIALERQGIDTGLWSMIQEDVEAAMRVLAGRPNPDPSALIGTRVLAVKPWTPGERGVLIVDYNHPLLQFVGHFHVQAILERYFIVLEPGWIGYCTPEVLAYSRFQVPIHVETIEPRDRDVVTAVGGPLVPIYPLSTNGWVDHRPFVEAPSAERDIDVVMVAAWATYKRHAQFFRALGSLRRRGRRLRIALIGTPYDLSREDILEAARQNGIEDQIEIHERIPADAIANVLARSKVHVLWSLREGSNRAIIEAMLAGVPTILREGFNYGHHYVHINPATGRYATEAELPDAIEDTVARFRSFAPREWVLGHMTCHHATAMVERAVRESARQLGEPWTRGLVAKSSRLNTQKYWDESDRARFEGDYRFLESTRRR